MKIRILLIILLVSSEVLASGNYSPKNLLIANDVKNFQITNEDGYPINIGIACSQTLKDNNYLIFCNYVNLYIMDLNTGKTILLKKTENINKWYPTGVKWSKNRQKLYVANYLGKDILVFEFNKENNITLVKKYTDGELVGPENIDVLDNGDFVTADFDNSKVIFFNKNGKVWSRNIKHAHGVSFSHNKKFILVSSLTDKKVYKLDLQGNLLGETGEMGWGQNGYMWPTSITSSNQGSCVSDAHTGKITCFNDDLLTQKTIGGNGPGVDLFNMPYGITWTSDGLMFVSDTFKNRILKINPKENRIVSIYQGFSRETDKVNGIKKAPSYNNPPLGLKYENYINLSEETKIKFNSLEFNKPFNSGYNNLVNNNTVLSFDKTINFFTSAIYYWVSAKNFKYNGLDCTIIGSPQVSEWLIMYEGITYPVYIGLDFWLETDYLISSKGVVIPLAEIASVGLSKIKSYIQAVKGGEPILEAIQNLLGISNFPLQMESIVHGDKGKEFIKNLIMAKNVQDQQKVAKSFLESVEKDKELYFVDIAIASMVLYDFNKK